MLYLIFEVHNCLSGCLKNIRKRWKGLFVVTSNNSAPRNGSGHFFSLPFSRNLLSFKLAQVQHAIHIRPFGRNRPWKKLES